ncbi:MAG: hypothetical protein KDC92_13265 [Bacteroidetes bacterium]|nr:hypothetical protein [Bacteroidota bacterium]
MVTQGLEYLEDKSVDLRADIYAAFVEGWFDNLVPKRPDDQFKVLSSGEVVYKFNPTGNGLDLESPDNSLYLHINAENEEQGTQYFGDNESSHEHNDQFSLTLSKGNQQLLIDPAYLGYRKSKKPSLKDRITGIFGSELPVFLADPLKHNTIVYGKHTPCFGTKIWVSPASWPHKVVILYGKFETINGTINVERKIYAFKDRQHFYITDVITEGTDDPANHEFTWSFNGYGATSDGSFEETTGDNILFKECEVNNDYDEKLRLAIMRAYEPYSVETVDGTCGGVVKNDYAQDPADIENRSKYTSVRYTWKDRSKLEVKTILRIETCGSSTGDIPFKPIHRSISGGNRNHVAILDGSGEMENHYLSGDTTVQWVRNPFDYGGTDTNRMVHFDGKEYVYTVDTSRGSGTNCTMGGEFSDIESNNSTFFSYDGDTFYQSNKRLGQFVMSYVSKFTYGVFLETLHDNTEITFKLSEAPSTQNSSIMATGSNSYSYDTTKHELTVTLSKAGFHEFYIEPTNKCILSCYFPSQITDTFNFETGKREVLGHEMPIKQSAGLMNIGNGSKMFICEDAVCRNRDSLILKGVDDYYWDFEGQGYNHNYRTTEGAEFRESFEFGSGQSDDQFEKCMRLK